MIERIPVDKRSGYTKQIAWIDKQEFRTWKVDYHDRKGELLKTFLAPSYSQYLNEFWRADRMEMDNHQTGKRTELIWEDYRFAQGLQERDFHRNRLSNVR